MYSNKSYVTVMSSLFKISYCTILPLLLGMMRDDKMPNVSIPASEHQSLIAGKGFLSLLSGEPGLKSPAGSMFLAQHTGVSRNTLLHVSSTLKCSASPPSLSP